LYWGKQVGRRSLSSSPQDTLADGRDVAFIDASLPPSVLKGNKGYDEFNHLDFLWGEHAPSMVYAPILTSINGSNRLQ